MASGALTEQVGSPRLVGASMTISLVPECSGRHGGGCSRRFLGRCFVMLVLLGC
jgi:hypothetical protein